MITDLSELHCQPFPQWPLIAGRAVSITLGLAILLVLGELSPPNRDAVPTIAVAGNGDAAANIAVLLALQTGPLGISVVLISIYPAFTAVAFPYQTSPPGYLATFVIREDQTLRVYRDNTPGAVEWGEDGDFGARTWVPIR